MATFESDQSKRGSSQDHHLPCWLGSTEILKVHFRCRFKPKTGLGFACGGSGSLFKSEDGGKSWKRDRSTDSIAGNLYAVEFEGNNGFILGNDGILLRYIG